MVFQPPSVWAVKTKVALYLSGSRAASVAIGSLAALVFAGVRLALLDRFVFRLESATGARWQAPIAKSKSESKSESRKTKPGLSQQQFSYQHSPQFCDERRSQRN